MYPEVDHLFYTEDGQFFLPRAKQYAKMHADKTSSKYLRIDREVEEQEGENKGNENTHAVEGMTVKEVAKYAATVDTVEELEEALKHVDTKGGKAAIEERIAKLTEGANTDKNEGSEKGDEHQSAAGAENEEARKANVNSDKTE